jgi:hypothetical protein
VHVAAIEIADAVTGSNGANAISSSAPASGAGSAAEVTVVDDAPMRTLAIFAVAIEDDLVSEPGFLELSETRHSLLPSGS